MAIENATKEPLDIQDYNEKNGCDVLISEIIPVEPEFTTILPAESEVLPIITDKNLEKDINSVEKLAEEKSLITSPSDVLQISLPVLQPYCRKIPFIHNENYLQTDLEGVINLIYFFIRKI